MTAPLVTKVFQHRMNDFARISRRRWGGELQNPEIIAAFEAYARLYKAMHPEYAATTYNIEEALRAFNARPRRIARGELRMVS